MADAGTRFFYDFADFRLDPQQRLLSAAADGRPIPLVPKAFEMLLYLVERRGESLSKNGLMKAIWPNLVVEENSLNQTISAVRRALGERPGEHRFIVTEPGRGYRFVAEVRVTSAAAAAPPPAAQPPAAPAATASASSVAASSSPSPAASSAQAGPSAASATQKSIAVLPLANLTGDASKEYFSDGMAEELIHTLARIPGLRVPSRTSSFAYKGRNIDVRTIARDLEVATVLEGSVRSAGERIRVTAQLIDGTNGFHLWSQNYDREFGDLFKLQDELAQSIVQALRVKLDTGNVGSGRPLREPPTRDLEAYHLYLQAQAQQVRPPFTTSLPRTLELLQQAIERDPSFAEAHNAMAAVRAVALTMDIPLPGSLAELESQILRTLERDPSLGSIHTALGVIYSAQGRWISAAEQFRQGLTADDTDPTTLQAYGMNLLGTVGYEQRYIELSLAAHRLAPAWIVPLVHLAVAYLVVGETEASQRYADLLIATGFPRQLGPLNDVLMQLALRAGHPEQASELAISGLPPELVADGADRAIRELFAALHRGSGERTVIAQLDRLRERSIEHPMLRRRFILWYVLVGAFDQAFEILNQSLDHFARSGTIGSAWAFLWMQEMLPFRRDPRFQLICRRLGLFDYWNVFGPPDGTELRAGQLIC